MQREQRPHPRRRTQPRWSVIVAAVLCVAALVTGTYAVYTYVTQLGYPKDMNGRPVVLPERSKAVQEKTDAVASVAGVRLRVPSTGLDVPVGELNEVGGVIDPPGFSSAYLVRNYGASFRDARAGTVFVVMHSCRGGAVCPGNYLIDVSAGKASVKNGADVYVNGLHYRVTGSQAVYKPQIREDAAVWANTPGRLVLFTCLQVPAQTESTDNVVVTATLVG